MDTPKPIIRFPEWDRAGRGRSFDIEGPINAIQDAILGAIPRAYAPYCLISFERIPVSKRQRRILVHEDPLTALSELISSRGNNMFIRSMVLNNEFPVEEMESPEGQCSLNGLVLFQHGVGARGMMAEYSLGIVDKVSLLEGGPIVEHKEYLEVFLALKKALWQYRWKPPSASSKGK